MNWDLYKTFIILADKKEITLASNTLNLSEVSIKKQIKILERKLKITLFNTKDCVYELTKTGSTLYNKLKNPINELISLDNEFEKISSINIGSHKLLLHKIFENSINQFYWEYPKINLNFKSFETLKMIKKLSDNYLDVVFSKKVENIKDPNIEFIKLGYLHDIFITSNNSNFANKILTYDILKDNIIYVPKEYSHTFNRLSFLVNVNDLNLKHLSYNDIIKQTCSTSGIGLVTKEYLNSNYLNKSNLIQLDSTLNLTPIEFGIYINKKNNFKQLNDLLRIIKTNFFFNYF